jgi:hypothetical protein
MLFLVGNANSVVVVVGDTSSPIYAARRCFPVANQDQSFLEVNEQ